MITDTYERMSPEERAAERVLLSGRWWPDGLAVSNYERYALMSQVFPRGYTMTDISMMIKKMLEVNSDLNRIMSDGDNG